MLFRKLRDRLRVAAKKGTVTGGAGISDDPFVFIGKAEDFTFGSAGFQADSESGWHGGPKNCTMCGGSGRITCPKCLGSGTLADGKTCFMCDGHGKTTCPRCNGSGHEP